MNCKYGSRYNSWFVTTLLADQESCGSRKSRSHGVASTASLMRPQVQVTVTYPGSFLTLGDLVTVRREAIPDAYSSERWI
jgi:hypothetical protein